MNCMLPLTMCPHYLTRALISDVFMDAINRNISVNMMVGLHPQGFLT